MAYCSNCGAYIPDGETKCVACGMSISTAGAAQAVQYAPEEKHDYSDMHAAYDKSQREQRERTEQWSSYAGSQHQAHSTSQNTGGRPTSERPAYFTGATRGDKNLFAILSYISFLFVLPFLIRPEDEFARFHARQGAVLFIASILIDIITSIIRPLGSVLSFARIVFALIGIINAWNGKEEELPFIGKYADKLRF